ncbi:MAG TPA: phage holin family protein [Acidiferrobacterales bacterium]|nr:phage holin family protein [Acidiferrobacterales bacterium]
MTKPIKIEEGIDTNNKVSITELLKNLISKTGELVRSEANVIKLEMQESTRAMILDGIKTAAYSGIALLGVLSLVAFLIIALGQLIEGGAPVTGFWVSALIIGLIFTIGGGIMAAKHAKQIGKDIGLPKSQTEFEKDKRLVKRELYKMKEAVKP